MSAVGEPTVLAPALLEPMGEAEMRDAASAEHSSADEPIREAVEEVAQRALIPQREEAQECPVPRCLSSMIQETLDERMPPPRLVTCFLCSAAIGVSILVALILALQLHSYPSY